MGILFLFVYVGSNARLPLIIRIITLPLLTYSGIELNELSGTLIQIVSGSNPVGHMQILRFHISKIVYNKVNY